MTGPLLFVAALALLFAYAFIQRRRERRSEFDRLVAELQAELDEMFAALARPFIPLLSDLAAALGPMMESITSAFSQFATSVEEVGQSVARFSEEYRRSVLMEGRVPLIRCVCGKHFDCPDGWHYGEDVPCLCTPDCALEDDDGNE